MPPSLPPQIRPGGRISNGTEPQRHESDEAVNPTTSQSAGPNAARGGGGGANPMRPPPRDAEEIGSNRCCSPDHKSVMGLDGGGGRLRTLSAACPPLLQRHFRRTGTGGGGLPAPALRRRRASTSRGSEARGGVAPGQRLPLPLSLSWPRGLEEAAGDWGSGGVQCGLAVRVESEEIVRPCVGTGWPTSQG